MDEILRALLVAHKDDLPAIRKYIAWVRLRRRVHDHFYFAAHWVAPVPRCHWVR